MEKGDNESENVISAIQDFVFFCVGKLLVDGGVFCRYTIKLRMDVDTTS